MTVPPLPEGYDHTKYVPVDRMDLVVTVGFDREGTYIPRFLVQLYYRIQVGPAQWISIARMDHNETANTGHNIYTEDLHVDIRHQPTEGAHLKISHEQLDENRGAVIRQCVTYLSTEAEYFIEVYTGERDPDSPPSWSDGGPTRNLISPDPQEAGMSQDPAFPEEDVASLRELTKLLAEATDTSPEELERRAAEMEFPPPHEAAVVNDN